MASDQNSAGGSGAARDDASLRAPCKDDKNYEHLSEEDLAPKEQLELYVERVQESDSTLESMRGKGYLNGTSHIPDELINDMLVRLPVKHLLRCRSVCKPWCSLIDSTSFVKKHLHRNIECNPDSGIVLKSQTDGNIFCSPDVDSLSDSTGVQIAYPLKTILYDTLLAGSCNGMVCLWKRECDYRISADIYLWNPATRKARRLPKPPTGHSKSFVVVGFGYDHLNDDYKVVTPGGSWAKSTSVYSLKSNSWTKAKITGDFRITGNFGKYANGYLYWLAAADDSDFIFAFDLQVDRHRRILFPADVNKTDQNRISLTVLNRCLCLVDLYSNSHTDIWLMNNGEVENSWSRLISVEQRGIFGSFKTLWPVAFSKAHNVLFVKDRPRSEKKDKGSLKWYEDRFMWYDCVSNEVKNITVHGFPVRFDLLAYTESLVQPTCYFQLDGKPQQKNKIGGGFLNGTFHLSDRLISDILLRLPVKLLLCFRCVSKTWCSLIDSTTFVKAHFQRNTECNRDCGIVFRSETFISKFYLGNVNSLCDLSAEEIADPLMGFESRTIIVNSCNGVVCLTKDSTKLDSDIYLWNPATRQRRLLPKPPIFVHPYVLVAEIYAIVGLGYDHLSDDYKVVTNVDSLSSGTTLSVYSLKSNSWTQPQTISNEICLCFDSGKYVDGSLYWLTRLTIKDSGYIFAFDLGVEKHRKLPFPDGVNKTDKNHMHLTVFNRCLCLIDCYKDSYTNIWLMNNEEVENSWSRLISVEQPGIFGSFKSVQPVVFSKAQNDVLFVVDEKRLMWCDRVQKEVKTVTVHGFRDCFCFDFIVYTESLVQLTLKLDGKHQKNKMSHDYLSDRFKLADTLGRYGLQRMGNEELIRS